MAEINVGLQMRHRKPFRGKYAIKNYEKRTRIDRQIKNLAESVIKLYFMYYKNIKNVPRMWMGKGKQKRVKVNHTSEHNI